MKKHTTLNNFVWATCLCLLPAGSIYAQNGIAAHEGKKQPLGSISKADHRWQKGGVFEGYSPNQEALEKRNSTTKHFRNANGSFTAQVMPGGIHYRDENGAWQDKDMTIVANHSHTSPYAFVNLSNEVKSYFPATAQTPMKIKAPGGQSFEWWHQPTVSFKEGSIVVKNYIAQTANATLGSGAKSIQYSNVYPNMTEEFEVINGGVENNTIIHTLNADINNLSVSGLLELKQFVPLKNGWKIINENGVTVSSNFDAAHFSISIPGMTDLVNFGNIVVYDHTLTKEQAFTILGLPEDKRTAEQQESFEQNIYKGRFQVTFVPGGIIVANQVPAKWLKMQNRVFPVTIDPTITVGTTSSPQPYCALTQGYGYQRNADIYLQSELGFTGNITNIEYYLGQVATARTKPTKIYMRTTSSTTLTSGVPWNATTYTDGLTPLLDANTTQDGTVGWKMLALTTPFNYTADNLLIMVKSDYGGSGSFQRMTGNAGITNRSTQTLVDNTDPPLNYNMTTIYAYLLADIRITYTGSTPVCAAPTAPTAGSVTATTAQLNWTQAGTPAQWQIKYGTTGFNINTGGTAILTPTKPYTLNAPLSPATTYDYYVRAICGPNDTSAWSPVTTFTTLAPVCAAPTAPTAGSITATTAQLNWTQTGTPAQWQIKYGTTGFNVNTGGTAILTPSKPYTLNPPLSSLTTYDYYVRAICGPNDTSAWSPVTTFTTLCTTPSILTHPDISRCGTGTVVLNATATAGATIQWYAATTGGTALATANTFTTPSLSATTSYYITAKTGTCESSPRQEIKAIIKQAASVDTITANLTAAPTVAFQAVNPQNVTTYAWSFGSGGGTSALQNPTFVYPTSSSAQNYTVRLIVSNDCGQDTVTTVITIPPATGVNDLKVNHDDLKLYPNPTAQYFRVENNTTYQLKQLSIINVLGQTIRTIPVKNNTVQTVDVSNMASGVYNIRIEFEEGSVIRKLEILK